MDIHRIGHGLDRRSFLKLGLASGAALSGISLTAGLAGCHRAEQAAAAGYAVLRDADLTLMRALIPAVMAGAVPTAAAEREARIADTLKGLDGMLQGLESPMRAEVLKLFDLLNFGLTRRLVAGLSSPWSEATPEQLEAFLARWRDSALGALNAGYRALVKLVAAPFAMLPASRAASGYPGPLDYVYKAANS